MELYVLLNNVEFFPSKQQIQKVMWEEATSVSHALDVQKYGLMMMSWDKWVDDPRWKGIEKVCEQINFEFVKQDLLEIKLSDYALFVDKRALYRAAILIAKKTNSSIGVNSNEFVSVNDFQEQAREYMYTTFEEAVEKSYEEIMSF